jgi:hypothetical protein
MKPKYTSLVGLVFLALIGYGGYTTHQVRELQSRVTALESLQARVTQLDGSVHELQEEQPPRPRLLGQREVDE